MEKIDNKWYRDDTRKIINYCTGTEYDENGYDKDGYDQYGYNSDGYDKDGYDELGYDKDGWNREGINKKTGEIYNIRGYRRDGFNVNGINKKGFRRDGFNIRTNSKYDKDGYNINGFDKNGIHFNGTRYDNDGYDKNGFSKQKIHKITHTEYDEDGYDYQGYDKNGFNRRGYNKDRYNKDGYDKKGFNKEGVNKEGKTKEEVEEEKEKQKEENLSQTRKNYLGLIYKIQKLARGEMSIEEYIMKSKMSIEELIIFAKRVGIPADEIRKLHKYKKTYEVLKKPFNKQKYLKSTALIINGEEVQPTEEDVDICIDYLKRTGALICDKTVRKTISQFKKGELDITINKYSMERDGEEPNTELEMLEAEQQVLESTLQQATELEGKITKEERKKTKNTEEK